MIGAGEMLVMLALPGARPGWALQALADLCLHLTTPVPARYGTVAGEWNLRAGPSRETAIVGTVANGAAIEVWGSMADDQAEQWLLIRDHQGDQAGWLFHTALDAAK